MIDLEDGQMGESRKETLSCGFVALLIALAYAEVVAPVSATLRADGLTFATFSLFWVFFLTTFRVFVGNVLYLRRKEVLSLGKWLWLYEFGVIVFETVILIFLAGLCSVEASYEAKVDFIALLVALYTVDVLWVMSQRPLRRLSELLKRRRGGSPVTVPSKLKVPWGWAAQNALLLAAILLPGLIWDDYDHYTDPALAWLLAIHIVAFLTSVVGYDFARLLDGKADSKPAG